MSNQFNFEGNSLSILTSPRCRTLVPPFRYNVQSLQVADGAQCEIFQGLGCQNMLDVVAESNPQIDEGDQF
ncbi:hypothetical protein LMH87_002339 [Akanthomyces muscarius]|uniref:Uncharacterized protein n=1 Tax=Akanthomyces muscarius TaxID=2231603 RepID=A0A9W8Q6W2_AKAMU|nr:hypothetical protein LMH87_002339 [Akanthomyces muscarius]KAJ4147837.1 hypothetical protein LMH87_002339 [Akanthomyces muscarius]